MRSERRISPPADATLAALERQATELRMEASALESVREARDDARLDQLQRSLERVRRVADCLADCLAEERALSKLRR